MIPIQIQRTHHSHPDRFCPPTRSLEAWVRRPTPRSRMLGRISGHGLSVSLKKKNKKKLWTRKLLSILDVFLFLFVGLLLST